jgi:hypothetical protein
LDNRWREYGGGGGGDRGSGLSTVAPRDLAALMTSDGNLPQACWRPDELGDILKHQLEAPLVFDLTTSDCQTTDRAPVAADVTVGQVSNFAGLFLHPRPPLQLLRLTKRFAKTSDRRPANPLPAEVATVLYYAAILAALLRHGERITRASDSTLRDGTAWVLAQAWVSEPLRGLFVEAQAAIAGTGRAP